MAFSRSYNPIWYFVDHVGNSLDDTYYAFFLQNTLPYLPQPVFHDVGGLDEWENPLEFQPSGTLPNNLYFDDTKIYRIEIRRGNTQSAELIWLIEDYIPSDNSTIVPVDLTQTHTENMITNSQFSEISFNPTTAVGALPAFTSTQQIIQIAPGWQLVGVGGAGSMTISQLAYAGDQNIPTNAPFALEVTSSGWTQIKLQQIFLSDGALWNNSTVGLSVTARSPFGNSTLTGKIIYATDEWIITDPPFALTPTYNQFTDKVVILDSTSTTVPPLGSTILELSWPSPNTIDITSIQLAQQSTDQFNVNYQQVPLERQDDHLFHYYQNSILYKPKTSILTAWNFSLNPFQFNPRVITVAANQTQYIADQTILHQISAPNSLQTGIAPLPAYRDCLAVQGVNAGNVNNRFALIQYIDPATIRPYWSYKLSSLVRARLFTAHGTTNVGIKMRLIYSETLPVLLSAVEPILSWDAAVEGSNPVFSAQWTAITPLNDPTYILPTAFSDEGENTFPAFSFNSFTLPAMTSQTMTLGVVIYITKNIDKSVAGTEDYIAFDKASLVQNEFAIETEPQTWNKVLSECQFYYEKSFPNEIIAELPNPYTPGDPVPAVVGATASGALTIQQTFITVPLPQYFGFSFNTIKRAIPLFTFWSAIGTFNNLSVIQMGNAGPSGFQDCASGNWGVLQISTKSTSYVPTVAGSFPAFGTGANPRVAIVFHYTARARLGYDI